MEPIAVVSMACRFPGEATDVERFWGLLSKARETWSKVPKDRFNQEAFYHPETSNQSTVSISFIILGYGPPIATSFGSSIRSL